MNRIIIAKISEGLGNQLFMYSNAYAISKKLDFDLCLDPYTGYYKNNIRSFMLNNFNISSKIAPYLFRGESKVIDAIVLSLIGLLIFTSLFVVE